MLLQLIVVKLVADKGGEVFPLACTNDDICNAIDFGVIQRGDTLGDRSLGIYSNQCGSNLNEPNPLEEGGWFNNSGVWFTFRIEDDGPNMVAINLFSDPQNTGDPINLEMAIYESASGDCSGNLSLLNSSSTIPSFDESLNLFCLEKNKTYFLLVDGFGFNANLVRGVFSVEITGVDAKEGKDRICDRSQLGAIPEGGSISSEKPQSNFCATSAEDGNPSAYTPLAGVWYSFEAPESGHVTLEARPAGIAPLDVNLAVYKALNGNCTGNMEELGSSSTFNAGESITLTCLNPREEYYVHIDGNTPQVFGTFEFTITDGGDITPVTTQAISICSGDSINVADNVYFESGTYRDTINLFQSCDSIIITELTVVDPIDINLVVDQLASAEGQADAAVSAFIEGGSGINYYSWCNGDNMASTTTLTGGDSCYLLVVDDVGCQKDTTFFVPYVTTIIPQLTVEPVSCSGASDAMIALELSGGFIPYTIEVSDELGNSQTFNSDSSWTQSGLSAGSYEFLITDGFGDTSFTVTIAQPEPLEIAVVDQQPVSCYDFCDGAIAINITGGNGNNQVSWTDPSGNSANPTALCAGKYFVAVEDQKGCTALDSFELANPEQLELLTTLDQPIVCFEEASASVSVSANYNLASLQWNNGATTDTLTNIAAGTYTVIGSNDNNCLDTASIEVAGPSSVLQIDSIVQLSLASDLGERDATASVFVSGGWGNYQVSWCNGESETTALQLEGGQPCAVQVSDDNGCIVSADIEEVQYVTSILTDLTVDPVSCYGFADGELRLNVFNGKPPYQIEWSAFSSGDTGTYQLNTNGGLFTLKNLKADTYQIYITDGFGETNFTVNIPEPVRFEARGIPERPISCFDDQNGRARVQGNFPIQAVAWSNGATGIATQGLGRGTYQAIVTSIAGCLDTVDVKIEGPAAPLTITSLEQITLATAFSENNASAEITVSGGWLPYRYEWCNGESNKMAENLVGGDSCEVSVTDNFGCEVSQSLGEINYVTNILSEVKVDSVSCKGGQDGSITISFYNGKAPYKVIWQNQLAGMIDSVSNLSENEPITLDNLSAGSYSFFVTDGFGEKETIVEVFEPEAFETSINLVAPVSCFGGSDGQAIVSANFPIKNTTWSNAVTGISNNNLSKGIHKAYSVSTLGCLDTATIEISGPEQPLQIDNLKQLALASSIDATDGSASVLVSGGWGAYTYQWCNGETGPVANQLMGGEPCNVIITDANGCRVEQMITEINYVTEIMVNHSGDSVKCFGEANGSWRISAFNGKAPYNVSWQLLDGNINGDTTLLDNQEFYLDGLIAGDYLIDITDGFGDTSLVITIAQPQPLELSSLKITEPSCHGFCDGRIEPLATGGTGAYAYRLESARVDSKSFPNVCAGIYQLQVLDEQSCQFDTLIELGQPEEFIVEISEKRDVSCFDGDNGLVALKSNGTPVAYNWNNGATGAIQEELTAGTYEITVVNSDNCIDIVTVTIEEPEEQLQVNIVALNGVSCHGKSDGRLLATTNSPDPQLRFSWNNGRRVPEIGGLAAGSYIVEVEKEGLCSAIDTFVLTQPEPLVVDFEVSDFTCLDSEPAGELVITSVSGGTPDYLYRLNKEPFSFTTTFRGLPVGRHQLIVEDIMGCRLYKNFDIQGPPNLEISLGRDQTIRLGDSLNLVLSANSEHLALSWFENDMPLPNNALDYMVRPLENTVYKVEAMDTVSLCMAEAELWVTVEKNRAVYMPTAFSPNGDGNNDVFFIQAGPNVKEVKTFRIFNRNGQIIFEANDFLPNSPDIGWDGKNNQGPLPIGTYVYFAEVEYIDGLVDIVKGSILLMR